MDKIKILESHVKVPNWKFRAFGLKKYHFIEAEFVRFRCDYEKKDGTKMFPFLMEVESRKLFDLVDFSPSLKNTFKDLYLVPWDFVTIIKEQ